MQQKSLLITRPFYENPTNYLFHWSRPIIELAREQGFYVVDLARKKAIKAELEGRLRKVKPNLVVLNGHGNEKMVFGQDNEPLITMGENEKLLANKIVFTRACLSARSLGKSCVQNGTKAYLGYDEDFIFRFEWENITKPLKDETAALFMEPSNQTARSLIKGNSAKQSNENGKNAFLKNIFKLLTSETTKDESETVRYLLWDMRHQICLGNENATI